MHVGLDGVSLVAAANPSGNEIPEPGTAALVVVAAAWTWRGGSAASPSSFPWVRRNVAGRG